MAESKTVAVVPLSSTNYSTWKIQCKMALIKEGLWNIVNGTETEPEGNSERKAKFAARRDKALATIVLAMEPSLLYLVGPDPTDPVVVWRALADQFQRKTWANKLELKRKLFSLRLAEGGSVQQHIKFMSEICDELSAIGETISEEDRVVYLLASLPESYSVLVTALEANTDVPSLAIVREKLLHEETKMKGKPSQEEALAVSFKKKWRCHFCNKPGHFKKDCEELAKLKGQAKPVQVKKKTKMGAFKVTVTQDDDSTDSESTGLVVQHALASEYNARDRWILDSGATCHMCNQETLFSGYQALQNPLNVVLGDGRSLQATGQGSVVLKMKLPNGKIKACTLQDVLLVPNLAYNLLSVTSASKKGKVTTFSKMKCEIRDNKSNLLAVGHREGSLYYLDHDDTVHQACSSSEQSSCKGTIWHRRLGHLGAQGMQELARRKMVNGIDFDEKQELGFCECCIQGKSHRLPFQSSATKRSNHPLDLVHSDVCGKIGTKSLGGGEYFVTFLDDHTRHIWVYILKHKGEVFQKFREWRALVEKSTERKVKAVRCDNGGEYTSTEFVTYLTQEGIKHELTTPHTSQQNGAAERLNRTLIEGVRTMLADSKLPHKFWAEALSTYAYLRNRSPTKLLSGITPHEAWYGTKPDISRIRIFGCSAYAHVPKVERRKLDLKARKCIMLGYGTTQKGYRLYDLERMKVIHNRDVVFNEDSTPGIQKESPCEYVELKVDDEPNIEHTIVQNSTDTETQNSAEPRQSSEENSVVTSRGEEAPRRSTRDKQKPHRYGHVVAAVSDEQQDPVSVTEVESSPDKLKWEKAMETEMKSLQSNGVWELVEPPPNRKIIGSKWIFKRKVDADGILERYKARLVAQGCTQKFGLDYEETFSPVVRFESIRCLLAMGTQHKLYLHQMDVSTAFLHGELSEEVYMKQPEGFVEPGKEKLVCRLKRSIYGLKQSPRCWNHALDSRLKEMSFKQAASDPCLYVHTNSEGEMFVVAVYVDDIILGGKSESKLNEVKRELSQKFEMKDLGPLHHFLGVKVIQDQLSESIWVGQPMYTERILHRFDMHNSKPVSSPVNPDVKLTACENPDDVCNQEMYQAVVGSLLYLSTKTRPDIAFAVSSAARFCASPTKEHWTAVKRILRYLNGSRQLGLLYKANTLSEEIAGFSDADWAGDVGDRKSTSGYVFLLGGAAVSWKSTKQTTVALSTAEAEYIALSTASQEAIWLQQLMSDLSKKTLQEMIIYKDNQSTICLAKNQAVHGRTKHIDIKYHFIRDLVEAGKIKLIYCATENMVADIFTKGLSIRQFEKLRHLTGVAKSI